MFKKSMMRRVILLSLVTCLMIVTNFAFSYGADDATISDLKQKLVVANKILDLENVAKPLGHVSIRIPGTDTFLITRSISPGAATLDDIVICDAKGKVIEGKYRQTYSEVAIHAGIYKKRKDINSVIHTHSDYVTALSMLEIPILPASFNALEMGPQPIAIFKKLNFIEEIQDGEAIADLLGPNRGVTLKGHGGVIVGRNVEEAVYFALKMELAAKLQWMASAVGKLVPYTEEEKRPALEYLDKYYMQVDPSKIPPTFKTSYQRLWSYYEGKLK